MRNRMTSLFLVLLFAGVGHAADDLDRVEKYFLEERYEKAAEAADRLIDAGSGRRDELYYIKGLSELKLERYGDARHTLERLIEKYPRSKRVADAKAAISSSYMLEKRISIPAVVNVVDKNVSIQVGCFKNRANAESLLSALAKRGYDARIEPPKAGDNFWRVKVGRFADDGEAGVICKRLERDGYDTNICDI